MRQQNRDFCVGIISYIELLNHIVPDSFFTVGDLMSVDNIPVVAMSDTLKVALAQMNSFGERYILVIDKGRMPLGMLSDIQIKRYMQFDQDFSKLEVGRIMTNLKDYRSHISHRPYTICIKAFLKPSSSF